MEASEVCAHLSEPYRERAVELFNQLMFMEGRLVESREQMANMPLIIAYKDTNGNTRTKENPAFSAYNSLMRNYISTLSAFRELVGDAQKAKPSLVKFESFAKTMRKVDEG